MATKEEIESIVAECCKDSEGDMNIALHNAAKIIAQSRRELIAQKWASEKFQHMSQDRSLERDNWHKIADERAAEIVRLNEALALWQGQARENGKNWERVVSERDATQQQLDTARSLLFQHAPIDLPDYEDIIKNSVKDKKG